MDNSDDKRCDDGGGGSNSGEMILSKKECTSCEQNNIDVITQGIDSVYILDNKSTCSNCGKKGDDINNICNKCKHVKYCNATCKKKHRHKHKKDCEEYTQTCLLRNVITSLDGLLSYMTIEAIQTTSITIWTIVQYALNRLPIL